MLRKYVLALIGGVIAFMGLAWFLQGIGVLPGSFMTGSQFWAAVGALALLAGCLIAAVSLRGK